MPLQRGSDRGFVWACTLWALRASCWVQTSRTWPSSEDSREVRLPERRREGGREERETRWIAEYHDRHNQHNWAETRVQFNLVPRHLVKYSFKKVSVYLPQFNKCWIHLNHKMHYTSPVCVYVCVYSLFTCFFMLLVTSSQCWNYKRKDIFSSNINDFWTKQI